MTFSNYRNHCKLTGKREGRYDVLKQFIDDIENDKLVKCDCCGEYVPEEYTFEARYDRNKLICEDCHEDGN